MRLDRTDRAEAAVILETDRLEGMEKDLFPDPDDVFEHVMNIEVVLENIGYIAGTVTEVEDRPLWLYLAAYLRQYSPKPEVGLKDVWTKDVTPVTEEECKKAAQALFRHHWESEKDCWLYFMHKLGDAQQAHARATDRYNAFMAKRLLGATTDHIDRPRTAAWTEFNRAYNLLRNLQADGIDKED
jgi:hypothetical protein